MLIFVNDIDMYFFFFINTFDFDLLDFHYLFYAYVCLRVGKTRKVTLKMLSDNSRISNSQNKNIFELTKSFFWINLTLARKDIIVPLFFIRMPIYSCVQFILFFG